MPVEFLTEEQRARSGRFVRRLRLPASVEQDRIRAEFRDGVLRVILPKQSPAERKVQR
jgi:HSP20 family molecular chaperone IbpA